MNVFSLLLLGLPLQLGGGPVAPEPPRVALWPRTNPEVVEFLDAEAKAGRLTWFHATRLEQLDATVDVVVLSHARAGRGRWPGSTEELLWLAEFTREGGGIADPYADPELELPPFELSDGGGARLHPRHPAALALASAGQAAALRDAARASGARARPRTFVTPASLRSYDAPREREPLLFWPADGGARIRVWSSCSRDQAGRVFRTALGISPAAWRDPSFRSHLRQGLLWSARRLQPTVDRVLVVSVDGLRSDVLLHGRAILPNFTRLRSGSSTLDARTDADATVTLPNHLGMVTGLPMLGPDGHGWNGNVLPPVEATLADRRGGRIPPSIFSVASAAGVHTAVLAGKPKFVFFQQNWPDALDYASFVPNSEALVAAALQHLQEGEQCLVFLHFRDPDVAGHAEGWNLDADSAYIQALRDVDTWLGSILDLVDESDALRGRTAILLTSDHGGGAPFRGHSGQLDSWVNRIIPVLAWTGDGRAADLYALNEGTRVAPGIREGGRSGIQPIRNADVAELALALLGLPPLSPAATPLRLRWE